MKYAKILAPALLALIGGTAMAATATWTVVFEGPGGHSNGDYGNVNAVHAGANAALAIQKALPDAVLSGMKGGVSVNAIAGDCTFTVTADGTDEALAKAKAEVEKAAKAAADQENAFRGVKKGDLVKGAPADIRVSVK